MPDPFSSNSGLGMNVALLPASRATFLITYFCSCVWSAIRSSVSNRTLISACPAEPTSWCWNSQCDAHVLQRHDHARAQVAVGVASAAAGK